jgi:hypothetical protein
MKRTAAGGAVFTPVTLDEIKKIVMNAFHALDPKLDNFRGEACIDLFLNDDKSLAVRVMTSVRHGGYSGADVGADAMRVGIWGVKKGRFLAKTTMVKRTPNWKDTLRERVEDALENYDDEQAKWDGMAASEGQRLPPGSTATEKQVKYLQLLLRGMTNSEWLEANLDERFNLSDVPDENDLKGMRSTDASKLIDSLKSMGRGGGGYGGGGYRRYADEKPSPEADTALPDALAGYIYDADE